MTLKGRTIVLSLALFLPGLVLAASTSCKDEPPQQAAPLKTWQRDCLPAVDSPALSTQLFDLRAAPASAQALRHVLFEELQRRQAVTESDWRSRLAGHLASNDWEAARQLAADPVAAQALGKRELPRQVTTVPALAAHPSAWAFDFERQALHQQRLDVDQGPRVVFQFATGCPFCPRAAQAIQADERLSRLFKRCGALLAPVDGNFDLADFARWQGKHNFLPALLVTDWSWLDEGAPRSFPSFLFLKDGRLVETIRGWPPEGRADELLQALKKIDPAGRCSG